MINIFFKLESFMQRRFNSLKTFLFVWVPTIDHKLIGIMYLVFGMFGGLFGTWYSTIIRLELQAPGHQILAGASHYYYTVITMHGLVMIFFSVIFIYSCA